jgi:hypothetical protein
MADSEAHGTDNDVLTDVPGVSGARGRGGDADGTPTARRQDRRNAAPTSLEIRRDRFALNVAHDTHRR